MLKLPKNKSPIALLTVSDLHFSDRAPEARSAEPDWFLAMQRSIKDLKTIKSKIETSQNLRTTLLYAGDIFDRHDASARLINFLAKNLPYGYSITGQHDLPYHNYQDRDKSAYYSLELMNVINHDPEHWDIMVEGQHVRVHPFSWKQPLAPCYRSPKTLHVALCHHYVWKGGHCHPGALPEDHVSSIREKLSGYDVAVFGDNHSHFICTEEKPYIINNGTFLRRRIDEREITPMVGFIRLDGTIGALPLSAVNDDLFIAESKVIDVSIDPREMQKFLQTMKSIADICIDFKTLLLRKINDNETPSDVRDIIRKVLNGEKLG